MLDPETKEAVDEVWRLFRETRTMFHETDIRIKETDANLRRLEGHFTGQWGKMMEALVKPGVLNLLRERGIQVHYVNQRVLSQFNGRNMEVDLILENEADVIDVEVKTTLKIETVNDFLEKLAEFPHFFPKYAGRRLYGAMAALKTEEEADCYAYRRGLFVLAVTGEGLVQIKNDSRFRPHDFNVKEPQ